MERAANDKLGQKLWWNHQPSASLVFISQETPNTWRKRNIFILMLFRWPCGGPGTPGYTRGEKGGRSTQGRVSFIIIAQEKLENIQILLTIVWTCFQFFFSFQGWQLPRPLLVVTLYTGVQLSVITYPSQPQPPVLFSMAWMVKSLASSVI